MYNIIKDKTTPCQIIAYAITNPKAQFYIMNFT